MLSAMKRASVRMDSVKRAPKAALPGSRGDDFWPAVTVTQRGASQGGTRHKEAHGGRDSTDDNGGSARDAR